MGLIGGIALILLGLFCLPSLVAAKSPNAKELLDKAAPYQGIFGIVICFWGLWGIISAILTLGWLGSWPLWWATRLAGNAVCFLGGAILGWGLIQKNILAKASEDVRAKAEESYTKLVSFQPKIGCAAIIVGIWVILYELILQRLFQI